MLTVELLEESIEALRRMRAAQGPLVAELEQPDSWKAPSAEEETRVLLRHGIYSSTHLLAMKQQAELMFWLWKYFPTESRHAAAERIQLEFTFLVEKVIPDRGWTAEWCLPAAAVC